MSTNTVPYDWHIYLTEMNKYAKYISAHANDFKKLFNIVFLIWKDQATYINIRRFKICLVNCRDFAQALYMFHETYPRPGLSEKAENIYKACTKNCTKFFS